MKSIDVIIPLYNGALYIRETLNSVLAQTLRPNKIIVVDDSSTDDSFSLVYDQPEILLLKNPGKGACMARNHGVEHSSADFVAFLDQDDLWHPDHLRLMINAFTHHPDAQAAISGINFCRKFPPDYDLRDISFYLWDPWQSFPFISENHSTSGMVFRRAQFKKSGGWAVRHGAQADYFAWYRSAIDAPAIKMKGVTLGYRSQLDSGWMSELRKDIPVLITSLIETANDLIAINLAKEADLAKELNLRRRIAVYHVIYSLINNLKQDRDGLIPRDIQMIEEILTCETEHFRRYFMLDLDYFTKHFSENQERLRVQYILKLQKLCSAQWVYSKNIFSALLGQAVPNLSNYER